MSFTYQFGAGGQLDQVRMLIADTDSVHPIFQDSEIQMALQLNSSSYLYASIGSVGPPPANVISTLRAAALLLDSLASNKARLAAIVELLDVKLSADKAAQELRAQAKEFRDLENNSGAFAIAEMVNDQFQARERVGRQFLRLEAGA
jgi:hypothetical protein